MIRIPGVAISLDAVEQDCKPLAANLLRVRPEAIRACRIARRAVDARRKDDVHFTVTLEVSLHGDEAAALRGCRHPQAAIVPERTAPAAIRLAHTPKRRPIVVGGGPAGLFAALTLARAGAQPILLERGRDARTRQRDVQALWESGVLDTRSNVQFGEGGAGTFSDGKLNTGTKDPRCRDVLETFVRCGAPEDILWQAKPHVGTDLLVQVVQRMRTEIEQLGGAVRFEAQMTGLQAEGGAVRGVTLLDGSALDANHVLLCLGHSARDTLVLLRDAGLAMQRKPFSIGARIEHPQPLVDRAQYGRFAGHPALGAADYKLSTRLENGRGAYTFCMCPGGVVVAAASEIEGVVTNGMSYHARAEANANSALLVDVRPEDFAGDDPLAGLWFQQDLERKAYTAGGGGYRAPAQRVEDFLAGRASRAFGDVAPSYRPGATPADLRACLPDFAVESMRQAIVRFDRQLHGFAMADAVLTGVETRSSSPVRILRDASGQASVRGIYPVGEGAGYAGGIMSAAVDGIRAATQVLEAMDEAR